MTFEVPLVLFGAGQNSQVLARYIERDQPDVRLYFCVDDQYYEEDYVDGKRVIPLSEVFSLGSPKDLLFLAPLYGAKMGIRRQEVYERLKCLGYVFTSYISKDSCIYTTDIGENVVILDGNTVQPFASIGNNVMLWSNNHIGHHSVVEDHSTITSGVIVSGNCRVGKNCFLGVNTTITDRITLAEFTFTSGGSLIHKNTSPSSTYIAEHSAQRNIDSKRLRY